MEFRLAGLEALPERSYNEAPRLGRAEGLAEQIKRSTARLGSGLLGICAVVGSPGLRR
jgi:hypothetical protein